MVRFVRAPDGHVVADIAQKLPGRGVWVSAESAALNKVVANKAFARGFKSQVKVPDDLACQVEILLGRRVLGLLAMAHKAGKLHLGFDQVKSAAAREALAYRIEACDGSEDGRGKIRVLTKAVSRELGQKLTPVIGCFMAAELGQALGRDKVVHAALGFGGFSRSLKKDLDRLSGFRALVPLDWSDREHES